MKTTILIIFLFSTKIICGQNDSIVDNRFCIKLSPISLLDPFGGNSYRLGAEFKIFRNYAISVESGGYIPNGFTGFTNAQGFILKPEFKLYLNRKNKSIGKFVSLEYQYKNFSFDYTDSISIPNTQRYDKKYTIHKDINCITVKYGEVVTRLKNRLIIEWHTGIGIRIVNSTSNLTSQEVKGIYRPGDNSAIYSSITRLASFTIPNIDLGVKFGYRIK